MSSQKGCGRKVATVNAVWMGSGDVNGLVVNRSDDASWRSGTIIIVVRGWGHRRTNPDGDTGNPFCVQVEVVGPVAGIVTLRRWKAPVPCILEHSRTTASRRAVLQDRRRQKGISIVDRSSQGWIDGSKRKSTSTSLGNPPDSSSGSPPSYVLLARVSPLCPSHQCDCHDIMVKLACLNNSRGFEVGVCSRVTKSLNLKTQLHRAKSLTFEYCT